MTEAQSIAELEKTPPFGALLAEVPELRPVYEEHLDDNGDVLTHVLMGDVTRFFNQCVPESSGDGPESRRAAEIVRQILSVLEDAVASGDPGMRELVSASFLENLDQDASYDEVTKLLGPNLQHQLELVEEG